MLLKSFKSNFIKSTLEKKDKKKGQKKKTKGSGPKLIEKQMYRGTN